MAFGRKTEEIAYLDRMVSYTKHAERTLPGVVSPNDVAGSLGGYLAGLFVPFYIAEQMMIWVEGDKQEAQCAKRRDKLEATLMSGMVGARQVAEMFGVSMDQVRDEMQVDVQKALRLVALDDTLLWFEDRQSDGPALRALIFRTLFPEMVQDGYDALFESITRRM